jgi:glycosidase
MVRNNQAIMKEFGTMDDFNQLLEEEIDKSDMKVIMNLVVNHTSDEHQWFGFEELKELHTRMRDLSWSFPIMNLVIRVFYVHLHL